MEFYESLKSHEDWEIAVASIEYTMSKNDNALKKVKRILKRKEIGYSFQTCWFENILISDLLNCILNL